MKKFIIPIVIAAALGIGAGVVVASTKSEPVIADEDTEGYLTNEVVKCGVYYPNGGKNSDVWCEVNRDYLIVKSNDVDKSIREAVLKMNAEMDYSDFPNGSEIDLTYVSEKEIEDIKSLCFTEKGAAGFLFYLDTNTLHIAPLGDFILVED